MDPTYEAFLAKTEATILTKYDGDGGVRHLLGWAGGEPWSDGTEAVGRAFKSGIVVGVDCQQASFHLPDQTSYILCSDWSTPVEAAAFLNSLPADFGLENCHKYGFELS